MTLEHLDTVISFVVILTGARLLAGALTLIVSALLGLHGTNPAGGKRRRFCRRSPKFVVLCNLPADIYTFDYGNILARYCPFEFIAVETTK